MNRAQGPSPTATALAVLRAVARLGYGCTAQEVRNQLRIPPTTAYRVLNALVGDEYLVRTPDLSGFGLGRAAAGLVAEVTPPVVTVAARAAIAEYRAGLRFGVHVLEFRALSLLVADEDEDHPLHSHADLRALHASAAGKLLLAQSPNRAVLRARGPLRRITPATIVDTQQIEDELDAVRERGYAVADEELRLGLACMAVPLRRLDDTAAGALCLAGPSARVGALTGLADAAREAAGRLAPLLY